MNVLFRELNLPPIGLQRNTRKPKILCSALLIAASLSIASCSDQVDYRGYLPRGSDVQKIHTGLSKTEVVSILGSPSTQSSVPGAGDTLYYISSVVETTAVFEPKIIDREIFAIHFDTDQNVTRLAHYGIEDGKIVDFISRKTPTRGTDTSFLRGMFGRLGQFGSPDTNSGPPNL